MSVYHFSSIFAWDSHFNFRFDVIGEYLCVFAQQEKDRFLYLPPLGPGFSGEVVRECFERMGKRPIARIENILDNQLPAFKALGYNHYHKADEYVYRAADVAALTGNAYKSQRHEVNLFRRENPKAVFRPYVPSDQAACARLYEHWAMDRGERNKDQVYCHMLKENGPVHAEIIAHTEQLGLIGRVVEVDDQLAGYTFGFPLNETTFCVLLEVVDHAFHGIGAFIFNSFCNEAKALGFEWINTMDDFGMPNVAKAKAAWNPAHVIPLYSVKETR